MEMMTNVPLSQFVQNPMGFAKDVLSSGQAYNFFNEEGKGVALVDLEWLENYLETKFLFSMPGMKEKIDKARTEPTVKIDWEKDFNRL